MKWEDIPVDKGAGKECVLVIVFKCLWKYITAIYLVQNIIGAYVSPTKNKSGIIEIL